MSEGNIQGCTQGAGFLGSNTAYDFDGVNDHIDFGTTVKLFLYIFNRILEIIIQYIDVY